MITNSQSGTRIDEIADGLYRISTPIPPADFPGGFTFNQYLIVDQAPLVFHTGMRGLFPLVSEAIKAVMPLERLRYVSFSHVEADECGALNQFLAAAPQAVPLCGTLAANISINDIADRPARALAHGESISLGRRNVTWLDAPHLPHNWECGYLYDDRTRTLLCGDLFTRGGHELPPITEDDVLEPSEAFRVAGLESGAPDAYSLGRGMGETLEKLAATNPMTLALMHGSAWRARGEGQGAALIRALGERLAA